MLLSLKKSGEICDISANQLIDILMIEKHHQYNRSKSVTVQVQMFRYLNIGTRHSLPCLNPIWASNIFSRLSIGPHKTGIAYER